MLAAAPQAAVPESHDGSSDAISLVLDNPAWKYKEWTRKALENWAYGSQTDAATTISIKSLVEFAAQLSSARAELEIANSLYADAKILIAELRGRLSIAHAELEIAKERLEVYARHDKQIKP